MKKLSGWIIALSILNLGISSVLGSIVIMGFGYPPLISILVSTALATVAETTIAPILDELGVIKTKMASLILGPGIIDDVAEVGLASAASLIVGASSDSSSTILLVVGLFAFLALAMVFNRLVLPVIARFDDKPSDPHLFLLMVSSALTLTVVSQAFKLGVLLGAITAGLVFQGFLGRLRCEPRASLTMRAVTYGFLGPIFFYGIGLSTDLPSIAASLQLTLLLLGVNFLGKFLAALAVGKLAKLNMKMIAAIGLGLSAKFSMGIIPVQIFYAAGIIEQPLFTAFVAVSTVTTMVIPFSLAYVVSRWRNSLE
jgi:Ca2+-transporting ATPase